MIHTFKSSQFNDFTLEEDLTKVFEKRLELYSRANLPKLWSVTDKLNRNKVSEAVSRKRRKRYKFYGILNMILGSLVVLSSLLLQKSTVYFGLLVVGISFVYFEMSREKPKKNKRITKQVDHFLGNFEPLSLGHSVSFSESGMLFDEQAEMPYDSIDHLMISDTYVFILFDTSIIILQKKDLDGDITLWIQDFEKWTAKRSITVAA